MKRLHAGHWRGLGPAAMLFALLGLGNACQRACAADPQGPVYPEPAPRALEAVSPEALAPPDSHGMTYRTTAGAAPANYTEITVEELLALAMGNNPTLAQAAQQVAALRGKWLQAGLYPNPAVGYLGDDLGAGGTAGKQGATFSQQLVTAGKLRLDRAVVAHEIAQAPHAWELQLRRVQNDVRAAAYRVMAAQRHIGLHEQIAQISREALRATEQLYQAKEVAHVDVLKAQIEYHTAELMLQSVHNDHRRLCRQLAILVGLPEMESVRLHDELDRPPPDWSWDDVWHRLRGESPERAKALTAVERAECELARQCAGRVPDVEVQALVVYDHTIPQTTAAAAVGVPLPIFDRNQGKIRQAQAELSAARREVERVELAIRYRLADVWRQFDDARSRAARYREEILPVARKSLELTQAAYSKGELGYLELLTAQHMFYTTAEEHARAVEELWVAAVQIDELLLSGGLEPVEEPQ